MQIAQRALVLVETLGLTKAEPVADDRAMILRFDDETRAGTMRSCQVKLNLSAIDNAKDKVWSGAETEAVIGECNTAVVILTTIPRQEMMALLETIFSQLFPGGKVSR